MCIEENGLEIGVSAVRDRMVVGFTTTYAISVFDMTLCDKVCQWLVDGRCFSTGTPVSFTNNTDRQDTIEILLKVALNLYTLTLKNSQKSENTMAKRKEGQTDKQWSTNHYIKRLSNTNPTKAWSGVNSGAPEGSAVNSTLVVHVVLIRLPGKRIYISFF